MGRHVDCGEYDLRQGYALLRQPGPFAGNVQQGDGSLLTRGDKRPTTVMAFLTLRVAVAIICSY